MAIKVTTLHPRGEPNTNVYPNIIGDCIPSDAVTSSKIAEKSINRNHLNFELWATHIEVTSEFNQLTYGSAYFTIISTQKVTLDNLDEELSDEYYIPATGNIAVTSTRTTIKAVSLDDEESTKLIFRPLTNGNDMVVNLLSDKNKITFHYERLI